MTIVTKIERRGSQSYTEIHREEREIDILPLFLCDPLWLFA